MELEPVFYGLHKVSSFLSVPVLRIRDFSIVTFGLFLWLRKYLET